MSESIRFENYELLCREDGSVFELGRGAMGVTYKAFDTDLHCHVALKVINPGILGSGDARERFLREARAAAQLRHPNIATAFRLGRAADDTHFYAMEFCEGPTLAQAVAERGPLPVYEAVYIAWQVSKALVLAGEHRLLHRDIKPANLILTVRGDEGLVVKVIDFGLAKSFADGAQSLATMGTGGFVGTAQFASPEQLEEKELDIRSDIYSLGHCLWFMLTARPPFGGSLARVMSQTLTDEPPWEALANVPEPVVAILRKMLAKNRDDRHADATALRRELQKCLHRIAATEAEKKETRVEKAAAVALDEQTFNARFPVNHRAARDALGEGYRSSGFSGSGESFSVHAFDPALTKVPALRREIEARVAVATAHPHPNLLAPVAFTAGAHGVLIASPWTEGFTLLDLLRERGALAPSEVLRVIEPLARAADHAVERKITGLDLSKGQVVAHFPGGLSADARARVLAMPVEQWPAFEIKAGALSLGEISSDSSGSLASMATIAPCTARAASAAPVQALAALACELLGAPGTGTYAPIARLSENANAVLRRAVSETGAFPNASAFAGALRTAIGSGGSSAAPLRPKTMEPPPTSARPAPPAPHSRPPAKSRAFPVLVLLAVAGLAAGYWFGIHRPREREREQREADAERAKPGALSQTKSQVKPTPDPAPQQPPPTPSVAAGTPGDSTKPAPPAPAPDAAAGPALVEIFPTLPDPAKPGTLLLDTLNPPLLRITTFKEAMTQRREADPDFVGVLMQVEDKDAQRLLALSAVREGKILAYTHGGEILSIGRILEPWDGRFRFDSDLPGAQKAIHSLVARLDAVSHRSLTPEEAIRPFVIRHLAAMSARSVEGVLADYARKVDYFEEKEATHESIGRNLRAVFAPWESYREELVGAIDVDSTDADRWKLRFQTHTRCEGSTGGWIERDGQQRWEIADPLRRPQIVLETARAFNERTGSPTAPAAVRIGIFCAKLKDDESSHDIERILANYAPKVDYGEYGTVDHAAVRKDKVKYFERWSRTTNRIKGNVSVRPAGTGWQATYSLDWTAENGPEKRAGEAEETLVIAEVGGALKVIQEKTKVTRQLANDGRVIDAPGSFQIGMIGAKVVRVRFFPSGRDLLPVERRTYRDTFHNSTTRFISFQIDLQYPARRSAAAFTIHAVWRRQEGELIGTQDFQTQIQEGWTDSNHASGRGADEPGYWKPGKYTVDFFVGKEKIATGKFQVIDR